MPRPDELPPLSEAQLEIMNLVWDRGEITVADVWKEIATRRPVARNTVQTLMVRLEEKGWLTHREEGTTFIFSAAAERSRTLKDMVARLVDVAFQGSAEGLVMALLDGREVSRAEVERIRALIEKAQEGD